jgi:hypothetical protein
MVGGFLSGDSLAQFAESEDMDESSKGELTRRLRDLLGELHAESLAGLARCDRSGRPGPQLSTIRERWMERWRMVQLTITSMDE